MKIIQASILVMMITLACNAMELVLADEPNSIAMITRSFAEKACKTQGLPITPDYIAAAQHAIMLNAEAAGSEALRIKKIPVPHYDLNHVDWNHETSEVQRINPEARSLMQVIEAGVPAKIKEINDLRVMVNQLNPNIPQLPTLTYNMWGEYDLAMSKVETGKAYLVEEQVKLVLSPKLAEIKRLKSLMPFEGMNEREAVQFGIQPNAVDKELRTFQTLHGVVGWFDVHQRETTRAQNLIYKQLGKYCASPSLSIDLALRPKLIEIEAARRIIAEKEAQISQERQKSQSLQEEIAKFEAIIKQKDSEIELHQSIGRHLISKIQNSITNLKKPVDQE